MEAIIECLTYPDVDVSVTSTLALFAAGRESLVVSGLLLVEKECIVCPPDVVQWWCKSCCIPLL